MTRRGELDGTDLDKSNDKIEASTGRKTVDSLGVHVTSSGYRESIIILGTGTPRKTSHKKPLP